MTSMNAFIQQTEQYLSQRDFDRAALLIQEAKKFEPDSVEPDVLMASVALHLGTFTDAATLLDVVLQRAPKHARARLLRGLTYEATGDSANAATSYELASRFDAASMPAWFNLGRSHMRSGRAAEAAIALERAADLAPTNVAVLAAWAKCLAMLGHARRAATVYLRCIEQNVTNPFFLVELADLLVKANERHLAEEVLETASRVFPAQGLFESKRAAMALERRDVATAARHAKEAVARQPESTEFWLSLATIELMRLKLDDARLAAERALKLEPSSWKANQQLGIIFETVHLKEKAISFYRRAVELAPSEWAPRNNLAVLLMEQKSPATEKEAKAHLEAAAASGQASAAAHFNLALLQVRAGQRAIAKASAQLAARLAQRPELAARATELASAL